MEYLLYGANGYTAKLIIKESLAKGLKPILAGRTAYKIKELAKEYDLPYRVFSLEDKQQIIENLSDVKLCLNAAGPFSKTAEPMIKACIETGVHYLDITGEIAVFELAKSYDAKASEKDVMLMPGVGFDVVPSDCLANFLSEEVPNATDLELGFTSEGGGISHGTASTMLEGLGEQGAVRAEGKIKAVPPFHKSKRVQFEGFSRNMATIPWGDISTAYTSTQIPNIEVYTSVPEKTVKNARRTQFLSPLLKSSFVKRIGQWYIDRNLTGPSPEKNEKGKSFLYGIIRKDDFQKEARLVCAEGYKLTALCAVNIATKVLNGNYKKGYQTPAMAYGWKLITEIPNTSINLV